MKKLVVKASLLLSSLIPTAAFAVTSTGESFDPVIERTLPPLPVNAPKNFGSLIGVIVEISRWMFGILMALSIVFILYAAFLYVISQGNEDRIKMAKTILIYAVVGLVVAVLAGGVSVVIQDFIADVD